MAKITKSAEVSEVLDDNSAHAVDIYLPEGFYIDGNVQLFVKFDKGVGSNSDGFALTASPLFRRTATTTDSDFVPNNVSATTLETALNWTDGHIRKYKLTFINDGDPFIGVRLAATYANGVDNTEEMTINCWLVTQ